ncbi:tRNA pseudouridine(55) synthase TruB [Candidatus Purcelliella pentastirinorum]|uniref:tRNA pseudouridine(55) synthase TruB n=1 Tax=Candidatus Purcelliella pentastirinorum TaxID=472834 RepID=UPI00236856D6|nr:tRNA pseudouridine(55) synthase TruB [Candidatus Purcelliella pentastirinorum]WDI78934.1 tRNA pseudouridine(55) synthase TruB [Candidatus Purcelliella pentastirinorum]WDR80069.1 tRNA pseudouridine(55) synthase TruB [Candidatus Purcelliella pentastirinorum]
MNKKNNINGMILLDKEYGLSSNNNLQQIKKILKIKKAGYVGTLDPIATGVLPICIGKTTKKTQYLIEQKKKYLVIAKLGESTNTFDKEGIILKTRKINFSKKKIQKIINNFHGEQIQKSPIYSALKYRGKPLYYYARKNIQVPIKKKKIYIHKIKLIYYKINKIKIKITCSKGTYIRSIINELGEILNCGAHVILLRRLQIGIYTLKNSIKLINIKNIVTSYYKRKNNKNINITLNILNKFRKVYFPDNELKF